MDPSDRQLLDRYLARNDETAFRLLLERYLTLVHGVARRVTRSDDLARDVSQAVFLRLASRAALIPSGLSLPAWLHQTTHSLAATLVRGEERRKKRERLVAAAEMNANDEPPQTPGWDALAPVIDRLVDSLPDADREIVLARFYRGEAHAAIAARLGLSEALARKRSSRALEKLRAMLGKRGIATSSSALATLLPAHASSSPAPAALKGIILQAAQGVTPLVPTGLQATLLVMNATQKILIVAAAAVFLTSLGYAVRPAAAAPLSASSPPPPGLSGEKASTAATEPRGSRGKPALPATAEGRRERLHQILAMRNALDRRREMLAFTSLLQAEHFEDLCVALDTYYDMSSSPPGKEKKPDVRPEHQILAAAWARKDPAAVLAALNSDLFLKDHFVSGSFSALAFALGASHPEEAVKWAKEGSLVAKGGILCGVGSVDLPSAVAAFLEDVPEDRRGSSLAWTYARMTDEPDILARLADLAGPSQERTALLLQVADEEARSLPTLSTVRLVMSDPEALRQADVENLFHHLAMTDPEAASATLQDLPPGPLRGKALKGVAIRYALNDDIRAAFALLDRYPEDSSDKLVADLVACGISRKPGGDAMAYLEKIHDPEMRESEQIRQLQRWKLSHPAAAQAWIDTNRATIPESVHRGLQTPPQPPSTALDFRPLQTP